MEGVVFARSNSISAQVCFGASAYGKKHGTEEFKWRACLILWNSS